MCFFFSSSGFRHFFLFIFSVVDAYTNGPICFRAGVMILCARGCLLEADHKYLNMQAAPKWF